MLFFLDCCTVIRGAPRLVAGAPKCSQACCRRSQMLPGAPKVSSGTPRYSQNHLNHSHGTPVPVVRDLSYSEGRPESTPRVWYASQIDTSKFTLRIISDTPGVFQWLKYILMMCITVHRHRSVFSQAEWRWWRESDIPTTADSFGLSYRELWYILYLSAKWFKWENQCERLLHQIESIVYGL